MFPVISEMYFLIHAHQREKKKKYIYIYYAYAKCFIGAKRFGESTVIFGELRS